MNCEDLIKLFIGGYIALGGALIWLVRTSRKDSLKITNNNTRTCEKCTEVMARVEKLLTNWRGH